MFGALARLLGEREGDQKAVESVKRAGLDSQFPAAARLFAPPVLRPMCSFTESCVTDCTNRRCAAACVASSSL